MQFNVVIGNPPYNNDIYLDFVTLAHTMSKDYSLMVTPAKWQAKATQDNIYFRQNIVPYMSHIVIYRDATEVFNIKEWGGISYYLIDKDIHNIKLIKNICGGNSNLNTDFEEHIEENPILLPLEIIGIIDKIRDTSRESLSEIISVKRQEYVLEAERGNSIKTDIDNISIIQGNKVVGYTSLNKLRTIENLRKWKCVTAILTGSLCSFNKDKQVLGIGKLWSIGPNQVPKGSFPILKYFDSEGECNSFISYCNTKLVSFLFYLGQCGTTLTKEFFRYIPIPDDFEHIYTNDELYNKYQLTNREQEIIECLMRER